MSGDPEFEEFLERRRPLFRRDVDDGLEPPAELDRIVLRQAREAIEEERPLRLFGMPRWAAPMAIAATLVLGLAVVFKSGMEEPLERVPEVRVENIAQRIEYPAPPAPPPAPAAADSEVNAAAPQQAAVPAPSGVASATAPSLVSEEEARRYAEPLPPAPPVLASESRRAARPGAPMTTANTSPRATSTSGATPAWRRDARTWQAEIERLRASGDTVRASAEQAEFDRQYRAYAVGPDR